MAVSQAIYPASNPDMTVELFQHYRWYLSDAPDEVSGLGIRTSVPAFPLVPQEFHGAPVAMLIGLYAGDPAEDEEVLRPLREFAEPAMDLSGLMPFVAVHEFAIELFPVGHRYSWQSLYAEEFSDDLLERIAENAERTPGPDSSIEIWQLGSAVSEVATNETA